MSITEDAAAAALQLISEVDKEHTNKLRSYGGDGIFLSSDDEKDFENPIYDVFTC